MCIRDRVEGVYTCDSEGRVVCIQDNRDPTTSCTDCLPGRDQLTNCTECLPGYDPLTNCFDCLPGRDALTKCTTCNALQSTNGDCVPGINTLLFSHTKL